MSADAPRPESVTGNYFVSAYPPFSCWQPGDVAAFRRVLASPPDRADPRPLGLYVHIPFCVKRCDYCYYLSYDDRTEQIDRYLEAVLREAALYAAEPALSGRELSFVYFGGGTPSMLSGERIRRLLTGLQEVWPWSGVREVTFECAPKTVNADKLRLLRECGVTRVSLGVQDFDDRVLERSARIHRVRDIERALAAIRPVGFDVVNIDLIVGLPGSTDASNDHAFERAVELEPDSVTVYQLEVPFNTPLARALRDGAVSELPLAWSAKRERLARGFVRLEQAGYTVRSGYSAVRDPRRHRFVYQDELYGGADLLGLGASSFSYLGGVHQQNQAALGAYVEPLVTGGFPWWRAYELAADERLVRELVLRLKLGRVEFGALRRRYGLEVSARFADVLGELERAGWLVVEDDAIVLTRAGLLRVDRLIPRFYLPPHQGLRYA